MKQKKYDFKLPIVKKIKIELNQNPDSWATSQSLPVYAYIPACSDSPSGGGGGGYTPELECFIEDPNSEY